MNLAKSMLVLAVWILVSSAAAGMAETPEQQETYLETGTDTETQADTKGNTGSSTDTEAKTGTGSSTDTDTKTDTGNNKDTETNNNTGVKTDTKTDAGTKSDAESGSDTGKRTDTDAETNTETKPGKTEPVTEPETCPQTEYTGQQTESDSWPQTEPQTESRIIYVFNIRTACENDSRYYDGTADVPLQADVSGLPQGMTLELQGVSASCDAGTWQVEPLAILKGEGSENWKVVLETPETLQITILPRPLRVEISDARKPYYSENLERNLVFTEETPVRVSGFMINGQETDQAPDGFELPEIAFDENVLQKDSPMFRDGEEIEYRNALILKKDKQGNITGNPTANYCFTMESETYFRGGTVVLSAPLPVGTLDYTVRSASGVSWQDPQGRLWIREGETILVEPVAGKGFTDGAQFSGLMESGTAEFQLTRRTKDGSILAQSQIKSISWQTDGEAPVGSLTVNGESVSGSGTRMLSDTAEVKVSGAADVQSGLRSVMLLVTDGADTGQSGEQLYSANRKAWLSKSSCLLTEEGDWQVFARLEDQVGNVRYLKSGRIVIDKTAPEIHFSGAAPGSANNGVVALEAVCEELHPDMDQIQLTLTGSKTGVRTIQWKKEETGEQLRFRAEDLPHKRGWDDLYTLTMRAVDQAGNQSEEMLRFSVNRFGSVLEIDKETAEGIQGYYIQSPTAVVIREVNVDDVTRSRITVGYEGSIRILRPGQDYQVEKRGTAQTWKEYCYRIPASVFSREGRYYVLCASRDRASNETDNRLQKQKLEFAVDRTEPSVIATGIEDQGVYTESSRTMYLECRDNLELKQVSVWLGDTLLCRNDLQEQELTLEAGDGWQQLRITASDQAGNEAEEQTLRFLLGNQQTLRLSGTKETDAAETAAETGQRISEEKTAVQAADTGKSGADTGKSEADPGKSRADSGDTGETAGENGQSGTPVRLAAGIVVMTVIAVILYRIKTAKSWTI